MAANLAKAAEALRKLGPKKRFEVIVEQTETNRMLVEAVDEETAIEVALDQIGKGFGSWNLSSGPHVDEVIELT